MIKRQVDCCKHDDAYLIMIQYCTIQTVRGCFVVSRASRIFPRMPTLNTAGSRGRAFVQTCTIHVRIYMRPYFILRTHELNNGWGWFTAQVYYTTYYICSLDFQALSLQAYNCSVTFDPRKERRERAWTISSRDACRERHCCGARLFMTSTRYGRMAS